MSAILLIATAIQADRAVGQTPEPADSGTASGLSWPAGVRVEVSYAGDAFVPLRGGRSRQGAYLDNLDLALQLNLDSLLHLRRTSVRFHVQSNRGRSISERVGDLQGLSNIEAPSGWRLFEAWLEYNAVPGRFSVLVGIYDLNSEIDVIPAAWDFLNSSFGFGPDYSLTGLNGPSTFPFTSVGVRLKARPQRNVYLELALTDGAPGVPGDDRSRFALGGGEGGLVSWEAGYADPLSIPAEPAGRARRIRRRIGRGYVVENLRTKVALGGWVYSRRFPSWASDRSPGRSWGLYALGERLLCCQAGKVGGLSVFLRLGMANDEVNVLGAYLGTGAAYTGPIPGRGDDVLGLAVAHARNGTPFLDAQAALGLERERAETAVELTYLFALGAMFGVQPNLQWIINPGMDPAIADAVVLGVRGSVSFEFP